jgi:hypothetical protein
MEANVTKQGKQEAQGRGLSGSETRSATPVTAPATNKTTAGLGREQEFMERVVAWPGQDGAGYINLHYPSNNPHIRAMPGKPFTKVDDFMKFVDFAVRTFNAVYFCLSTQSQTKTYKNGNVGAERKKENAVALKSIWIDVDVKPGGYATTKEALDGIDQFYRAAKLPPPSALVLSGGGVHVYWISDRPLATAEWRPYAEGLKAEILRLGLRCDAGLTTDAARVLRVPGTFNNKTKPRRPVRLAHLGEDYDFSASLAHLATNAPKPITATVTKPLAPFDTSAFIGKRMDPAFIAAGLNPQADSLADGIAFRGDLPLDPAQVFKGCPHFQDSFKQHGQGQSQGLWMLTVLASTFFNEGRGIAHTLSKDYPTYTLAETDAMYDRKLKERETSRSLGWPSCAAFESEGCKQCATCVHKGQIKSPLNLALRTTRPTNPVAALMTLRDQGARLEKLLVAMNTTFAVVKYSSKVMVAIIDGKDVDFMKLEDFHNLLANLVVYEEVQTKDDSGLPQKTTRPIILSKYWFKWRRRRQYVGRGVVFEPGGPLEIPNDMLNLWRGFGIEPKQGDWSPMRNHIREVICSGNEVHFQYLIKLLAYGVQHPDRPLGVCVAIRGDEGAGKGFLWRNYGKLFGKHFKHIAQGEHLTGRFNAALAEACFVFLDEALWAGDRKGEQILKALVTEDTFQLERKFCDPIPVKNRLRIGIASNNDWILPVGTRGRRHFVLDASDKYADEHDRAHAAYWEPLQAQFGDHASDDGRAAMLYDLLHMGLTEFNPRAVPNSAAKTEQKLLTQTGTEAWLFEVLQDGAITKLAHGFRCTVSKWDAGGMQISSDDAYDAYVQASHERKEYKPRSKVWWSRDLRRILKDCVSVERPRADNPDRKRLLIFRSLAECRRAYSEHVHADNIEWQVIDELETDLAGESSGAEVKAPDPETDAAAPLDKAFAKVMAHAAKEQEELRKAVP